MRLPCCAHDSNNRIRILRRNLDLPVVINLPAEVLETDVSGFALAIVRKILTHVYTSFLSFEVDFNFNFPKIYFHTKVKYCIVSQIAFPSLS